MYRRRILAPAVAPAVRCLPLLGCGPFLVLQGALADVPAVVRSGLTFVYLFPRPLTNVVHEESGAGCVRIEGKPERVTESPGEGLLAPLLAGTAYNVAATGVWPCIGVRVRNIAIPVHA